MLAIDFDHIIIISAAAKHRIHSATGIQAFDPVTDITSRKVNVAVQNQIDIRRLKQFEKLAFAMKLQRPLLDPGRNAATGNSIG